MSDDLRGQIAEALRTAAYSCDGSDCGQSDDECQERHPVRRPEPWRYQVRIEGSPEGLADAVLAIVQPKLDKLNKHIEGYRASRKRWMDAAYADRRASNAAAEELAKVRALANDFVDPDPCWYDHHGYCQAHGWFATEPRCPHARAREMGLTVEVDE